MCALPDNAPMAAGVMRGDLASGTSSRFLMASESAMADASGNNPGSGRGSSTPLSDILTICLSCAAWILSPRFVFHSCYDPASSLRKRNDVQGKGWLDFSLLGLTNGVAWADSEDNVSWARTGGSKG